MLLPFKLMNLTISHIHSSTLLIHSMSDIRRRRRSSNSSSNLIDKN